MTKIKEKKKKKKKEEEEEEKTKIKKAEKNHWGLNLRPGVL